MRDVLGDKTGRVVKLTVIIAVLSAILALVPTATPVSAAGTERVVISEFLASNGSGLADEDGDNSDWIELYNPSSSPLDITGWHLTDDAALLTKWTLPSTTLAGNGRLVVFASDKDRAVAGSELHTNFKLSAGGEYLAVVEADGTTIADEYTPEYPAQQGDVSYGRGGSCDSVTVEAETGSLTGAFITVNDGSVSGGAYLTTTDNGVDRYGGFDASQAATFSVTTTGSATYAIDTQVRSVSGGDSFWVSVNGGTNYLWDTPAPGNFVADQVANRNGADPVLVQLDAGTHTIVFGLREDGTQLDRFTLTPQTCDTPGAGGTIGYFTNPTPGGVNSSAAAGFVDAVEASVPHGFYDSPQSVALTTSTAGATIRYTLDGSEPTATTGSVYSSPLTVNSTTTLRAIAVQPGWIDGPVMTATYLFLNDVVNQSATPPAGFPTNSVNGQVFSWGMDPDIVNGNAAAVRDSLEAIPTISVVTDVDNLFDPSTGIYVNANNSGRDWERPASVELIDPSGAEAGFEIAAGLRIRGGFSRSDSNPKHAFRLFFRDDYAGDLEYPLFGAEGVDTFEKVDLRTSQNYSWSFRGSERNTMVREVFSRDLLGDLGQQYTRSRHYHLYLNGQYFGVFMSQERVSKEFAESYFGGDQDDYDVVKHDRDNGYRFDATDGTETAWRALWPIIQDQNVTNAEYAQLADLVDFDSLIDAQLIGIYTGDLDGSPSNFLGNNRGNNWYALRDRTGTGDAGKWKFFVHDAEHSLGSRSHNVNLDRTGPFPTGASNPNWSADYLHPHWIHAALLSHPDYLAAFEARAGQVLRGNGAMTPAASQARWDERENVVAPAMLAESARWGDSKQTNPLTVSDWSTEVAWVENNWIPARSNIVLQQLGLPLTVPNDPPVLANPGTQSVIVADDVTIALSATDPDGGPFTWTAADLPAGLAIDEATGEITGQVVDAGDTDVTVTVNDPVGEADSETFTISASYKTPSRLILNEWNAVDNDNLIEGGDSFFGSVLGNGGDWFELVVTEDNLDVRGWSLQISDADNADGILEETDTFTFADSPLLSDLRAGTIITVSEDLADDVSYNPAAGDWWINLQANSDDAGAYFTADSQSNFGVNNQDWQLLILDDAGEPVFGPAGEGAAGVGGVGGSEVGELEEDPSASTTPASLYDDGNDSTFGAPNGFDNGFQDFSALRPTFNDNVEPDATVTSPVRLQELTDNSVVLTGTATDNVGVAGVKVAVRNRDTGEWLRADGTFGGIQFIDAVLDTPGATSTGWSFPVTLSDGDWGISVRAEDGAGNRDSTRPWVVFSVLGGGAPVDADAPDATVDVPTRLQELTGPAVVLSGEATDDVAVAEVRVGVQDRTSRLWLQADGTFGPFDRLPAVLDAPGTTSTGWSFAANLPDGEYGVSVLAIDATEKRDPTRAWVRFLVSSAVQDTEDADTQVATPVLNEVLPGPSVVLDGTATDNVGVTRVGVSIRSRTTGGWLQSDGTFGSFAILDATMAAPGSAATDWTFAVDLPADNYSVFARSYDAAGNIESTRAFVRFSVS
jgi:hypothetical protein